MSSKGVIMDIPCDKIGEACLTCDIRYQCFTAGTREPDGDLRACLSNNEADGVTLENIRHVAATVPGANDELEWYWIVLLNDGRWALVTGSCDYTGWD